MPTLGRTKLENQSSPIRAQTGSAIWKYPTIPRLCERYEDFKRAFLKKIFGFRRYGKPVSVFVAFQATVLGNPPFLPSPDAGPIILEERSLRLSA